MLEYFETLSYTAVPVLIAVLGGAFIYREYLNHRATLLDKELTLFKAAHSKPGAVTAQGGSSSNGMMALRAQAYERMVLYLERITPDALIMRMHQGGMSADLLRNDLAKAVREEFDHNLSQQIYVSDEAWKHVVQAKEETLQLFNIAHEKMGPKATGLEMSRLVFSILSEVGRSPNESALRVLRSEARKLVQVGG